MTFSTGTNVRVTDDSFMVDTEIRDGVVIDNPGFPSAPQADELGFEPVYVLFTDGTFSALPVAALAQRY